MTQMPPIPQQMEVFNIPLHLKHDHSPETLEKMESGLRCLDMLMKGGHDTCVRQIVLYSEMNIKFLFMQALIDKGKGVDEALQIYVANLMEIFLPKKVFKIYEETNNE